jgi:hypothetical protein
MMMESSVFLVADASRYLSWWLVARAGKRARSVGGAFGIKGFLLTTPERLAFFLLKDRPLHHRPTGFKHPRRLKFIRRKGPCEGLKSRWSLGSGPYSTTG